MKIITTLTALVIGTSLCLVGVLSFSNAADQTLVGENSADVLSISLDASTATSKGRLLKNGEIPTPQDVARDAFAARLIIERNAPNGVITIFGSARAKEGMVSYDQTRQFAYEWTKRYGDQFPIMTGGGPGIMEAGNRGAKDSGGKSLYFSTYFRGNPEEKANEFCTDGYLGASFAQRESDLVDYAAGVIIAPGGVGTSWEIFETLSKIQTDKKAPCPVILLGSREIWQPLYDYMEHLKRIKTISPEDAGLLQLAETPEEAIRLLAKSIVKFSTPHRNVRKSRATDTRDAALLRIAD